MKARVSSSPHVSACFLGAGGCAVAGLGELWFAASSLPLISVIMLLKSVADSSCCRSMRVELMAAESSSDRGKKESTASGLLNSPTRLNDDVEDPAKSPPHQFLYAQGYDYRHKSQIILMYVLCQACYAVLQSWVSKKFMRGCVVLFPVAVTFFITWWFIQFVGGFFSPIYERLGIDIFGLGFITSIIFIFFVGIFASSWLGSTVFLIGEWFIKRMPFVKHIHSASKQISSAISPELCQFIFMDVNIYWYLSSCITKCHDQNTTAFKEVAIIRHPRVGEYAFGFITSSIVLQRDAGDEELCSVCVPTNHLYIGDIFLVSSKDIIRPNLSIREGIEIIVSVGMSMPQIISPAEELAHQNERIPPNMELVSDMYLGQSLLDKQKLLA
ncbi:hypothetical protein SASPL_104106 [Salvia splendens]|uniref:Protein LIKE COV 2 n=1 Tax=Salvia splendens TaxID=180675 RepID=A0A8X9A7E6_SALSN|nr:hypothetical protein SASPL_104106 [Salvia splendens]